MDKSRPVRILYMEDDVGLARLVQKRMRRAGYNVDIAGNGKIGLEMYETGKYDIIAVDQQMPGYSGIEVIKILASMGPLPPVVMITGQGNELVAVEALKIGAGDYVVKGVDGKYLETLPGVVERLLERRRLIEEKKAAVEALRHSERQLELIADNLPALVSYVGLDDLRYRFVNIKFEKIFKIPRTQIIGSRIKDILDRSNYESVLKYIDIVRQGQSVSYETSFMTAGARRWLDVNYVPDINEQGDVEAAIMLGFDITERKIAEDALKKANEAALQGLHAAEAANRAKSVFLASVSHELRTPLNAILGFSKSMADKPDISSEYRKNLDIIHNQGEHLLSLINRMIEISRIEDTSAATNRIDTVLKDLQTEDKHKESDVCQKIDTDEFISIFAALPSGLIADLEQAIFDVNIDHIYSLIELIRKLEAALADALKDCVDNFEYEKILKIIQQVQEGSRRT